jgi:hypothetical protein
VRVTNPCPTISEAPMSSAVIQLLVLAGIAIFLILRLRNVLGTREGFEKPPVPMGGEGEGRRGGRRDFEVIEGGVDTTSPTMCRTAAPRQRPWPR